MKPPDYHRNLRAERKAAGLCARCGNVAPEEGHLSCRPCLDYVNAAVKAYVARKQERERIEAAKDASERKLFVRACSVHRLPLVGVGLDCPRGHQSRSESAKGSSPDDVLSWLVLHVPSRRVAATVVGDSVVWEPWFETAADELMGKLAGRERDGFAAGHREHRADMRERSIRGWDKRRGHAA